MTTLNGKVAVITGGASGIGLAIARAGVAAGMQVVIADIEEAPLAAACEELGAVGVRTDVTDPASVAALAAEVREVHGTCDLVFNNAGVGSRGRIIDSTLDDWNWVIDVNLRGVVHVIDAFLPMLLDNPGGGHLINTASLAGLMALVSGPYTATKYAVVGISETLRRELADTNVRVSVLCPGFVRTNIMKSERNRPRADDAPKVERRNSGPDFEAISNAKVMDAAEIAAMTLAAVQNDEFWIIGDPELFRLATPRYDELRALADRGA